MWRSKGPASFVVECSEPIVKVTINRAFGTDGPRGTKFAITGTISWI